jgi:hypothetical protein
MADVKNFGLKGIGDDVQLGKSGGRTKWSSGNTRFEFYESDGSTLAAVRAANVDVQGTLLSDDITASAISISGDATITGDLTVNGSTTTVSSTNTTIADSLLELGTGTTGTPANDVGLVIERGDSNNVFIGWDESEDRVRAATGTFTGSSTGALTMAVADFEAADIKGTAFNDGTIAVTWADEDDMSSDSATKVPTQQSVKAYVDTANTNLKAYVDGLDMDDDLGIAGDSGTGTVNLDSQSITVAGDTGITTSASGQTITVDLDDTAVTPASYGSTTAIPTFTVDQQGRLTAAGEAAISTTWTVSDGSTTSAIDAGDTLVIAGGTNITSTVSGDQATLSLDATLTGLTSVTSATLTDGNGATITGGDFAGVDVTASGVVSFGTLTDSGESIAVTKFVDEADGISNNDNDTTIPTSAAVVDYVANNAGDGLLLRASFTANSSDATFNIGTVPNVSGRTYYASRVILNVATAVSGGSVAGMLVKDNAGAGNTLAAATENDVAVGTYVIDIDYSAALTKNAAIQVAFVQANGSTAATPTGGVVNAQVEYKFV